MIIDGNKLQPEEGYKYITNEEVFSTLVFLGKNDSVDNWHDTNEEPPTPSEEATEQDYQNNLRKLGTEIWKKIF